jgi:phage virion morphogenesis protein
MLEITVDDRALVAALQRLQQRMGNLRPVMRGIATELEARVEQRFELEVDPNGRRWKELHPETIKRKKRKTAILYDSGDMQGSLTSAAGPTWAQVGFGQPYAAYHEWGTRHMPRRGLLLGNVNAGTLGAGDRDAVLELLSEFLEDQIGGL